MKTKICLQCSKEYTTKTSKPSQRFCSISCGALSRKLGKTDTNPAAEGWTEELAYIIGLIWADGCLSKETKQDLYRITIALTDKEHIERLRLILSPERKLYSQQPKGSTNFNMSYSVINKNKEFIDFCIGLGLTERKSLDLAIPDIPPEMLRHFIRGFFDGDGSIAASEVKGKDYYRISFTCGCEPFIRWLKSVLEGYGMRCGLAKDKRHGAWALSAGSRESLKILSKLFYEDASIYLERKYKRFQDGDIV